MKRAKTKSPKPVEADDVAEKFDDRPGPESAGQAGDTQGLSGIAQADSQSVEELVEEGQFFEAAVISGIENAPPADAGEVRTKQVPTDDVPDEYLEPEPDVDK